VTFVTSTDQAGWVNQQLIEFLASLSRGADEAATLRAAVEGAVEAVEAEVGAVLVGGSVAASIGFPRGRVPVEALVALAGAADRRADLPGIGPCWLMTVALDVLPDATLLLARSTEGFSREETALLRAMGRVLELVVRGVRNLTSERSLREQGERQAEENRQLIASLRERQDLLERLAVIQRLIASRAPVEEILDAVLDAAADLIGEPVVGLRLIDRADPDFMDLVAARGIGDGVAAAASRSPTVDGIGGRAISEGRLVISEQYPSAPENIPTFVRDGVTAAIAAPLLGPESPMGSLVVASRTAGRLFSERDQQVLLALAEHAKLALNDARTVDALQRSLDSATHRATHDDLTGLPNRVLFLDRLEDALRRARRTGTTLAVVFVDIDEFKLVNDTLGHDLGDALLRAVAERLGRAVRSTDTAARFGGDEFALLLETVEPADVVACVERVLAELREPLTVGGQRVLTRASIGVSVNTGGDRVPGELLREADVAMYQAKAQGKDRFVLFEGAMQEQVRHRMELELDLHRALEREEFVLWFQPVVDLASEEVTGVEALVRWDDPSRGLVPPGAFIPVAEETGLMVPLGRWILGEACRLAAGWRSEPGMEHLSLSVNISPCQLRDPALVDDVRRALDTSGLAPTALKLELTESALIADTDVVVDRLARLKALGLSLSIDDFGTGYSSLGYLRRFQVDELKIDKSFVDDLQVSRIGSSLAEVVVTLASTLGMRTVAEGVETAEQARLLRSMGCVEAQGYHFYRPMPAEQIRTVVVSRPASAV
jgi:diguanylate cyclase (GGDEF)-like protein